ncbi:uncharacterized protein [Typha latifolia]|uniref:uncharacterized protein n=1 Tax=Typha latifolia TaxID=4733 RepID=UPI003C2F1858
MGGTISKCYSKRRKRSKALRARVLALEGEIKDMKLLRECEIEVFEQHAAIFACKEEEWKKERKKHREETARLRMRLEEEEERGRCLEEEAAAKRDEREWCHLGAEFIVEHMKEEQARREEAVEKWKQLYLAIKTELDDLIQRTHQGERFCWAGEDGVIEGLQRELQTKEEMVESQRWKIAAMEKEGAKKDREIDILKQSLRILSSTKKRCRLKRSLMTRGMRT